MAETKQGMTTQQKVGIGLGIAAALGGIALAASKFGGEDKPEAKKIDNPFAGIRKRLGRKSCGGCGVGSTED